MVEIWVPSVTNILVLHKRMDDSSYTASWASYLCILCRAGLSNTL